MRTQLTARAENFVGSAAGTKLKAKSGWNNGVGVLGAMTTCGYCNGTDDYGFSALPTYVRPENGDYAYWRSVSEGNRDTAYRLRISYDGYVNEGYEGRSNSFSVRCIKD
jgi:uncharacterized protein (TIGR02145 family)